jgi:hypothetical protein
MRLSEYLDPENVKGFGKQVMGDFQGWGQRLYDDSRGSSADWQNLTLEEKMKGLADAGIAMSADFFTSSAAGLNGIARLMETGSLDEAVNMIESTTASGPSYEPQTSAGQANMDTLGVLSEPAEALAKGFGDVAFNATDSPAAGTLGYLAAGGIIPGKAKGPNKTKGMVDRESAWQELEKANENVGVKRNKSGRYVGGPVEVKSPQKRTAVVNKYVDRTEAAIDAGIPPGYFYEEGSNALKRITDSAAEHNTVAELYGPTSTQVGPYQNTNYAVRALDQNAMGVPVSVGLYPNSLRPKVDSVLAGEEPWKGYKVDRYSHLLGPRDKSVNPLQDMPPNDQWEGYGTGFEKGQVPSGPTQVAWSDDIRRRASDKINMRRAKKGQQPLKPGEVQELHWAAIRAETDGRPLQLNPADTLQGSLPAFGVQHAWEAEPGGSSGIGRLIDKDTYADEVAGVVLDKGGKDNIVRAMGGRLQEPAVRGTGVWEGEFNPGFQSRSFGSWTQAEGMDPASAARIDSTEAVRQYMLGQEGRAYNAVNPKSKVGDMDIAEYETGAPPSPGETGRLQGMLDDGVLGGGGTIVPTEKGYRAVMYDADKELKKKAGMLGDDPVVGQNLGKYTEMDWAGGNATVDLLGTLDNSLPGAGRLADSPATRQIAGDMADLYQRLEGEGKLKGNHKLNNALRAWQEGGLDAVRELVKKGLAPAALLGVLAASEDEQSKTFGNVPST